MKHVEALLKTITDRLHHLAETNAIVGRTISVGDRHVIPLCELSMGFGGGGGAAQGEEVAEGGGGTSGKGMGAGVGGGASAAPVAVVIVDGATVRIEGLDA